MSFTKPKIMAVAVVIYLHSARFHRGCGSGGGNVICHSLCKVFVVMWQ